MIILPILALVVGVVLFFAFRLDPLRGSAAQYAAIACLAGLDSICGGIRSAMEGKYASGIFITGFIANILIAGLLGYLGDKIYIDLFLAVALVLGGRIFNNLSLIRRYLLTKWQDSRQRKLLQASQPVGEANP
jgi:small basic protein